jgi:hypothetical protein
MDTQPLTFEPLTLPYAWAVTNASPKPTRAPCSTSLGTVLELRSAKKNKRTMKPTHTTPTRVTRYVYHRFTLIFHHSRFTIGRQRCQGGATVQPCRDGQSVWF